MHITDDKKLARLLAITKEVDELHPLLKKLLKRVPSVTDVEYTHGNNENGADFVLSKVEQGLGVTTYVGVVVKCGNIAKAELPALGSQIEQCGMERLFQGGKKKVIIGEIWVLTNGTISPSAQEFIHHKYASQKIILISRDLLTKLIDENFSAFWTELDVETGDYFTSLLARIGQADKAACLLPDASDMFYVEHEVGLAAEPAYIKFGSTRRSPAKENIFENIEQHRLLIVEGEAGMGKSKFFRRIASHYCESTHYHVSRFIPVLGTFKELTQFHGGDLKKLCAEKCKDNLGLLDAPHHRILLMLDAADEVHIESGAMAESLLAIALFVKENPNFHVLVSSRSLNNDAARSSLSSVRRLQLLPLTTHKLIEFLRHLCKQLSLTDRILNDLKHSQIFRDLPKSPIAAILLASLLKQEDSKELPSTLPQLYSKYFEVVLGRWEESKGLQSQREYDILDAVLMRIATYFLDNELNRVSIDEAKGFFREYLGQRHYSVDVNEFFDRVCHRHQILAVNTEDGTFGFKHRTFAEFLHAKALLNKEGAKITERIFDAYWLNTLYFYVGLKKDCPELLTQIVLAKPASEGQAISKAINTATFLLAGYATPYNVIREGVLASALAMAEVYLDVSKNRKPSSFQELPELRFLWLLQFMFKQAFAYPFLGKAVSEAALDLAVREGDDDVRAYALFFLNVTHMKLGGQEQFDFLLTSNVGEKLPLDIMLGVRHESEDMKPNAVLKRMDQNFHRWLKGNLPLKNRIAAMYTTPLKDTLSSPSRAQHGQKGLRRNS